MRRLIKKFPDDSLLEYGQGRFDEWCIYFRKMKGRSSAIKDVEIFGRLEKIGLILGPVDLYFLFVDLYQETTAVLAPRILHSIAKLAKQYGKIETEFDFLMTSLYAGMVAEENKKNAILRKRIKRLGVHQILIEDRPATYAANFSRGRDAKKLHLECKARGF